MNDELTPTDFLTDFLLEQIAEQPEPKRVLLYRALAADTNDPALAVECRKRASDIEQHLKNERQMLIDFRARHIDREPGAGNGGAQG